MPEIEPQEQLREEFNRWAESGKGESMEHEHWPITKPTLELMEIAPADTILEVGCGGGWLSRILSQRVPQGHVIGMDISDEMIERARQASPKFQNLEFVTGAVDEIPCDPDSFSKVISVESSYYWPDPAKGIREIYRVLGDGGSAWILINYYRDNPHCHQWGAKLAVPTHLLSADEWTAMFREGGFMQAAHRRIVDPTPAPEVYTGRWFRDARQLAEFRALGALLVHATK
ncbi:MAG: class I SAM-dependent methyltransferase [Candidatus Acidiferrales bacterium]